MTVARLSLEQHNLGNGELGGDGSLHRGHVVMQELILPQLEPWVDPPVFEVIKLLRSGLVPWTKFEVGLSVCAVLLWKAMGQQSLQGVDRVEPTSQATEVRFDMLTTDDVKHVVVVLACHGDNKKEAAAAAAVVCAFLFFFVFNRDEKGIVREG